MTDDLSAPRHANRSRRSAVRGLLPLPGRHGAAGPDRSRPGPVTDRTESAAPAARPAAGVPTARAVPALALAALLAAAACAPTGGPTQTVVSSAAAPGVGAPMNRGRTAAGLPPLSPSAALTEAAVSQARYTAARGELTHRSAGNATVMDRVKARGYRACIAAENLAAGQPDAASVTAGWLASPGHRRNILLPRVTHWGAGSARTADGMRYWTMVVAGGC